MKTSIELIWKEGFLAEKSLVAPQINDLYNKKSIGLVNKMKRMYKVNLIFLVVMAAIIPILYYFLDLLWQGIAVSVLVLLFAGYSKVLKRNFKIVDHGATSLDYLKAFDRWLKDTLLRGEKVLRFIYPLTFLILTSVVWSVWTKNVNPTREAHQDSPGLLFTGNGSWIAWIIAVTGTLSIYYFSGRIHRWDVRLVYGRILRKLEETIAEMEQLAGSQQKHEQYERN